MEPNPRQLQKLIDRPVGWRHLAFDMDDQRMQDNYCAVRVGRLHVLFAVLGWLFQRELALHPVRLPQLHLQKVRAPN